MTTLLATLSLIGIVFIILIVNKQIIGAGLYSVFSPLVMAGLLYSGLLSGMSFIILILAAFLAQKLTNRLVKQIYGSQILNYLLTTRLTILLYFGVHYAGYTVDLGSAFTPVTDPAQITYITAYIILFVSVSSKLFAFGRGSITRSRRSYIVWFFIISYGITKLFSSTRLFEFLDSNNWMIILVTFLLIFVGIYNGLQLKEIIRFRKLLWKQRSKIKYNS